MHAGKGSLGTLRNAIVVDYGGWCPIIGPVISLLQGPGGVVIVVWAARAGVGGRIGVSGQVRKKCAEPEMVCMVVSRFLKYPIQIEFIGKRLGGPSALSRAPTPSGVGGYVRKRELRKHSAQLIITFSTF